MTRLRIALLALLMASGWIAAAARAHADTDDDYLEGLHQVGIYSSNGDTGLIILGHVTCNAFGIGESFSDVETLILTNNPKLAAQGAAQLIGEATAVYCPQYGYKFGWTAPANVTPRNTGVVA